jgi:hypothetical protein
VHDGIQVGASGGVRENDVAKSAAVEAAIRLQDPVPEPPYDGVENRLAWRLELPRDGIGVNPLGAPCLEQPGNGALAGGDVAGDGDPQPPRGVRTRAAPPR